MAFLITVSIAAPRIAAIFIVVVTSADSETSKTK